MPPLEDLGPLRARVIASADKHTEKTDGVPLAIVLMHGFGASGDDLVGLAGELDAPPGSVFLFPHAPHDLAELTGEPGYAGARAWWLVDFAARERAIREGTVRELSRQVPDGLAEARAAVGSMLDAARTRYPEHRVVLGGFSQGAMLTLDVALRDPARALAGLVLLSGTIIAEDEWTPLLAARKDVPVFQSHGRQDPILPFPVAERLHELLVAQGFRTAWAPFGGPHTIAASTMNGLNAWLREQV